MVVHGDGAIADQLALAVSAIPPLPDAGAARQRDSAWTGLAVRGACLVLTDGRCANDLAIALGTTELAVFDWPMLHPAPPGTALAHAVADSASAPWRAEAPAWLAALGWAPQRVEDTPGLVVARTIAMLVNEAADAVLQGVCTPAGADAAMKLGVNYPAGPFEWLARWGSPGVIQMLDALDAHCGGERYRVSPWLRRKHAAL